MILVVLGTQDKQFDRLLKVVDKEIENGNIKDQVIVQAGHTKYQSDNMKIFDLLPAPEFEKLMNDADIVITHGGAGTILTAIKKNKKVIAVARLAKYKEHHNDHQKQIVSEFKELGYILEYCENDDLGRIINDARKFKPKKFVSNTSNMIKLIENYIDDSNHTAWYHKYKEILLYLFFGWCSSLVNILTFMVIRLLGFEIYISNALAWLILVIFAFITNKLFLFENKGLGVKKSIKDCFYFFGCLILFLVFDMGLMYLMIDMLNINEIISKVISSI